MASSFTLQLSLAQAQAVLDKHCPSNPPLTAETVVRASDLSLSSLTSTETYTVRTTNGPSYMVKAAPPLPSDPPSYIPTTLEFEYSLSQKLGELHDVPHAKVIAFDPSLTVIPYLYLLSEQPPGVSLAEARASNRLTERQNLQLDLRLGAHFRRVHDHVQNDWFGLPTQEKDELYSWQEAFTYLLETVLQDAQDLGEVLPYEDIRRYLSRAIGFFLFDDCEVPSLVSFLEDAEAVIVDFNPEQPQENEEIAITAAFSTSHALWGDPLLETLFVDPTKAFLEGYGGSPIVFNRQQTKRMWYTLFQAAVVLVQTHRLEGAEAKALKDRKAWARDAVAKCVRSLENAPCY